MKKAFLPLFYFPVITSMIMLSFLGLVFFEKQGVENNPIYVSQTEANPYKAFAAVPKVLGSSTGYAVTQDGTAELVCQYLAKYQSPMLTSCREFSQIFESHNIDPVFALAIAQCESNLGKKMPIPTSQDCYQNAQPGEDPDACCHNSFGWGVHSAGTLCFATWEESYEKVAQGLEKKYLEQGLETTEEIMSKYNKISAEERNGSWGRCVNQFTEEINTLKVRKY